MGHVVEQRPDGEFGEVRPGRAEPETGTTGQPSGQPGPGAQIEPRRQAGEIEATDITGSAGPAGLDAEQWRQFEQFRQFQQFQRFQHEQQSGQGGAVTSAGSVGTELAPSGPPPTAPGRKVPGWLQWLGKKILAWLIFFILLAIFATWLFNQLFGRDDGNSTEAAARAGGGTYHTEELLAKEPYEAVRKVYHHIAQQRFDMACGHFDQDNGIQQRFARNTGGHADCRQAVLALHDQVTHINDYAESIFPRWYDPAATSVRIDSCDFGIEGGPALGVFTVTQVEMGQWLITDHERGPKTCAPEVGSPTESGTVSTDTASPSDSPGN